MYPYLKSPENTEQNYPDPNFLVCSQLREEFTVILGEEFWQFQFVNQQELAEP
jgi:hypothetical protein